MVQIFQCCSNTSTAESVASPRSGRSDPGWYVNPKIQDQDMLTWCIDTVAQVSVMPEAICKSSYGKRSKTDRQLVGAGDVSSDIPWMCSHEHHPS